MILKSSPHFIGAPEGDILITMAETEINRLLQKLLAVALAAELFI